MSTGVSTASGKAEIFEAVLKFMPDWVQITVLALVVLVLLVSWAVKIKRKIAYRRAVRNGQPIHAAARHGQAPGAAYLGQYAPQQQPQTAQHGGSGADHLGPYAPQQQGGGAAHLGPYAPQAAQPVGGQPSGADFLGAYAPRHGRTDGPV
ncbi:hypothetical protein ACFYOV_21475 [Streptomyces sp. NPDC005931]|uniref:hypothetical protein n=1 Tax=Streptomyces sp. NPDC005931 TaxID=3364737 RepID=UPI0036C7EB15